MRTVLIVLVAIVLAACGATTKIDGHKIRATASSVVERDVVTDGLHERAPAWFKEYWRGFLRRAEGGYAVMALDRNGRGAHYVFCAGSGECSRLNTATARSWADVHYKHGSLKGCRAQVREEFPTAKPDCAIYAINNKIVWQGVLPWERQASSSVTRAVQEQYGAKSEPSDKLSKHSIAVTWEGHRGILTGSVTIRQGARSGRMSVKLAERDETCEGQFWFMGRDTGGWDMDCGNGLSANGQFTGFGEDKGGRGEGTDSLGRKVQYILGAAGSG